MSDLLYSSTITSVRFYLSGDTTAKDDSFIKITSPDLFRNNTPYPEGLCDAHTGTNAHEYRCQTCLNKKELCLGHEGHIELNYPVWNPLSVTDGRKWIKLICFECYEPIISDDQFKKFSKSKRLDEASKIARAGNKNCAHCGKNHPVIKKDPTEPLVLIASYLNNDKKVERTEKLYSHNVGEIFSKILDETVIKLGKDITSHPRNFIVRNIKVPPITIRTDVKKIGGGRSTNDDLTTALQVIIKKNDSLPAVLPPVIDLKLEKAMIEINNAYYDYIKATGEDSMNSYAKRWKGKYGRFRRNLEGKRVRNMARSTIIGSTHIKIDEVGVPLAFAKIIQYEEVVQEYNKQRLLEYVQNGTKRYPGATIIIKKSTGKSYGVDSLRDIDLESGDIIHRDMIDGDIVNFNRQPSLKVSNIGAHRAIVIRDPTIKTLIMNVMACVLYDADFDGDQMNLIISAGIDTRVEISELSAVANWVISHTSSSPIMGQVDDSIIGSAELTRSNVLLDKYHAMMLFQNTTVTPSFGDMSGVISDRSKPDLISGRDCVSKLFVDTPINFTRFTEWYDPNIAAYMNYDPTEIKVKIEKGRLLTGVLDKKNIGKGSTGGIYHIIANDFGAEKTLEVMYNMQQAAVAYLAQTGFTIGVIDLLLPDETRLEVERIASDIINKSRIITEELHSGEIIPPIGKTIEEFYEERQISNLSIFDDFNEPILSAINTNTNNLFKLIQFGSKGKKPDMFNMMTVIGQKIINGQRTAQKFGYKRTLPSFKRFDASPEARGYITNSYLSGMTSTEYVFNAMAARFDLITKALSTSITGEQMRTSIKNLESTVCNNFRQATKGGNVIQFAYGDDYLDPRRVEKVKFPTIMISDEAFKEGYFHQDYPEFFDLMTADRAEYRNIFLNIERINVKDLMTDERNMPVAIERIIRNVRTEYEEFLIPSGSVADTKLPGDKTVVMSKINDNKSSAKDRSVDRKTELDNMVKHVMALCDSIPYVLVNEIQEKSKSKIPDQIKSAAWLLIVLIRSYLHPNALEQMGLTMDSLKIITDRIRVKYAKALIEPGTTIGIIAAQSFSAPLTQYMLDAHHRSASGGSTKSGAVGAKEIFSARAASQLRNPTMLLPMIESVRNDRDKVQEIANSIEMMIFQQFITLYQIYFEKYGEPVHSQTVHEKTLFDEFTRNNPLLKPPGDLSKWCIRFVLNKTTMILKNMPLELIINKLRDAFPDTFIVYSPENSPSVIIRVYMRMVMFKGIINVPDIEAITEEMMKLNIRGVDKITNAVVVKMIRNQINADGSISRDENQWGILTSGTNLRGIFRNKFIDKNRVQTDANQEIARMFGIEASRQRIISGLSALAISNINPRHYMTYADEMTYTGKITSIERSGLKTREGNNVLLRMGTSSPMSAIEEAVTNSMEDTIGGITAAFLVGATPSVGSIYNSFHVNQDFVKQNMKKPEDLINELFT